VLAAETAVFVHFKPVRVVLFVFCRVVISLLAFVASEGYFYSHRGTSFVIVFRLLDNRRTSLPVCIDRSGSFVFIARKMNPSADR